MFERVIGQQRAASTLASMIEADRIPHTLLFAGPHGVGKSEMAFELAAKFLCERGISASCGECGACRRAARLEHPDLHVLFPYRAQPVSADGQATWLEGLSAHRKALASEPYAPVMYEKGRQIVAGLVGEVHERLQESAFEGGRKVCVILECDRLNVKTANALLKILEEPPAGVHFIMTTERLSSVLPTIVSRASVLRFRRLNSQEIASCLNREGIAGDHEAIALSAEGSVKTAKVLAAADSDGVDERVQAMFADAASGNTGGIVEQSASFLYARDPREAEALIYGMIRLTRALLERRVGLPVRPDVGDGFVRRFADKTNYRSLSRLSAGLERGLDMLGRNVNIAMVMSSIQYEIYDAFGK